VSLAVLNLREILGWIQGSQARTVIPGFSGFFHLNSRVLTLCIMSPFLCNLRRIHVLGCASEFMRVTIPGTGSTFRCN